MEWHRAKNVIIVILLIINGLLLVLVGGRRSEARRYEQSALEGAIQVLAESGISMAEDVVKGRTGLSAGKLERSIELERAAASALLGENVEGANRGGGLYIYTGEGGQISFRSGGELSTVLKDHPRWMAEDPTSHAYSLLAELGVEGYVVFEHISEGSGTVICQQTMGGSPLFSCRLTFLYESGSLTGISGTVFTAEKPTEESGSCITLSTALMHVLDEVLTSGTVCSEVLTVEPGWLPEQSFNDRVNLVPMWFVSTNTADYYVNGITGKVSRAAEN